MLKQAKTVMTNASQNLSYCQWFATPAKQLNTTSALCLILNLISTNYYD